MRQDRADARLWERDLVHNRRARTTEKGAELCTPRPSLFSLNQAERPPYPKPFGLAGGLSEVTALGIRHWTTSFRC